MATQKSKTKRSTAPKAAPKTHAKKLFTTTDLKAIVRKNFKATGLTVEQVRKIEQIYQDLLIVDSWGYVLRDALYERCEDYGAHYANLIDGMQEKLKASYTTLDYMGANVLLNHSDEDVSHG